MLGLGLNKPTNSRTSFDELGYVNATSSFWTHDLGPGSTSLDNKTHICIVIHASWTAFSGNIVLNNPNLFYALRDLSNDLGFRIHSDKFALESNTNANGDFKPGWYLADGSGALGSHQISPSDGFDKSRLVNNWSKSRSYFPLAAPEHALSSSHNFGLVFRFDGSETNESKIGVFSNSAIVADTADITGEANLGQLSDKINLQINNDDGTSFGASFPQTNFTEPTICIHKISVWNELITDAKIMAMMGFGGETFEDTIKTNLNGFYAMHSRFKGYSTWGINRPAHEWDFSNGTPKYYTSGTFEDTGLTGGLDMTATGSPPIGSRSLDL